MWRSWEEKFKAKKKDKKDKTEQVNDKKKLSESSRTEIDARPPQSSTGESEVTLKRGASTSSLFGKQKNPGSSPISEKSRRRTFLSKGNIPANLGKKNQTLEIKGIVAFIDAVQNCCSDPDTSRSGYFAKLDGDYHKILLKAAEIGFFSENIEFLEQFHAYSKGDLSGTKLFTYLDPLNLDDNEDKKLLDLYKVQNALDGEEAKDCYKKIALFMSSFLMFNLHAKQITITSAMKQLSLAI